MRSLHQNLWMKIEVQEYNIGAAESIHFQKTRVNENQPQRKISAKFVFFLSSGKEENCLVSLSIQPSKGAVKYFK